jgi:hypothetical protein
MKCRLFCAAVDVHRDDRTVSRSAAIGIAKFVRGEQVDCPGLHGAFRFWEGAAHRYYGAKATGPAAQQSYVSSRRSGGHAGRLRRSTPSASRTFLPLRIVTLTGASTP